MEPGKYLYIDSLRGIAILMVIACHQALYFENLSAPIRLLASYGQTGVFLFFVVSAFTLCNSMRQRQGETNAIRNFFIRRYFRIAPLYYLGIVVYLLLRNFLPDGSSLLGSEQTPLNIAANVALVHGFMPSAFTGAVPGGWSIGTEWAFYLLFPLLFAGCMKIHARFGWTSLLFTAAIVAAVNASILAKVGMENNNFWFWYDFVLNQIPVFMTGIILFVLVQSDRLQPDLRRDVPMFLVVSGLGLWALHRNLFIMLPLVSAISFAGLFNIMRSCIRRDGWLERIGRASYSMYILHFVMVLFAADVMALLAPEGIGVRNLAYAIAVAIAIVSTYVVSRVSEKHIEQRFIAYGRSLIKPNSTDVPVRDKQTLAG